VVVHHQRERILSAAVALIAERGYRAVSVSDIVKGAAIARAKFYENFASKEDCFLSAYDRAMAEAVRRIGQGCEEAGDDFPARVAAAVAAFLRFAVEDPALIRACVVEAPAMGPPLEKRLSRTLAQLATMLRDARDLKLEVEPPENAEEWVMGGIHHLVYQALLSEQEQPLEELGPQLTEFALLPFLGAAAAHAAVAEAAS
jgi:AcrR family transcriptional regulator